MSKDLQTRTAGDVLMDGFKKDLERVDTYVHALIPFKGGFEKFKQMTLLAVLRTPNLLTMDRKSLLLAVLWAASKDLEPGVDDGVWLIPFKGRVTPIPAYKGLIKKAVETDSAKDVDPQPVYSNDEFSYTLGLNPSITHQPPPLNQDRGELIGAYVVITLPNGEKKFKVMDRAGIERCRNAGAAWKASQSSGPWVEFEEAMFLKTIIKQGLKTIPVKNAYRDLLADDGRMEAGASVAALLHESGLELPTELREDETSAAPEPPDTSKFDELVAAKVAAMNLTDAAKKKLLKHMEECFQERAKALSNKKKVVTVEQLKMEAVPYFEPYTNPPEHPQPGNMPGFWRYFLAWEEKKYGKPKAEPKADAGAKKDPEKKEPAPQQEAPESAPLTPEVVEEGGPQESKPPVVDEFEAARDRLWAKIIDLDMPLKYLKENTADGIVNRNQITQENIKEVEKLAGKYKA